MAEPVRKCARCRLRVQGVRPHEDGHSYCPRCLAQIELLAQTPAEDEPERRPEPAEPEGSASPDELDEPAELPDAEDLSEPDDRVEPEEPADVPVTALTDPPPEEQPVTPIEPAETNDDADEVREPEPARVTSSLPVIRVPSAPVPAEPLGSAGPPASPEAFEAIEGRPPVLAAEPAEPRDPATELFVPQPGAGRDRGAITGWDGNNGLVLALRKERDGLLQHRRGLIDELHRIEQDIHAIGVRVAHVDALLDPEVAAGAPAQAV